ncbi:Hint domain-containing protein [Ancylobacter oerskovii]|nr:Hint domain-containing protein [Ancylobacter oerskovii]MBS7545913.1 Hint domain-containing protein [Ancylobacter oerskovii]
MPTINYAQASIFIIQNADGTYSEYASDVRYSGAISTTGADDGVFEVGEAVNITGGIYNSGTFEGYHLDSDGNVDGVLIDLGDQRYSYYSFTSFNSLGNLAIVAQDFTPCFLAGTFIATPEGERSVEDLAIGDMVLTVAGEVRPVRWIGRKRCATLFADPLAAHPIRIGAGALGENLPVRDLYLSPDHALFLEGLLVQAAALVNGTTVIRHVPAAETFTYYHIELDDHALVLAEGVPAESFVDNAARARFDNHAEYVTLFGEERGATGEIALPRVKSARQLPPGLRARLAIRVAA